MDLVAESVSAGLGGIICTTVLYPLEIVKNKLQVMTNAQDKRNPDAPSPTFGSVARHIWKMDGARGLMWGNTPSCVWGFVEKLIYFYSFALCRYIVERLTGGPMSTSVSLLAGYACEWTHLPFTMPLEVWTVRVQHTRPGTSIWRTLWEIYDQGGVRVFFKSASAFLVLATKPAIKYTLYERVRQITIARRNKQQTAQGSPHIAELGYFEAFVLGAAARSLAEVLIYPYTRAKMVIVGRTKAATTSKPEPGAGHSMSGSHKHGHTNAALANLMLPIWTIKEILVNEGFLSLYQGIGPQIFRGVLSSAIMLSCKEKLYSTVRAVLPA